MRGYTSRLPARAADLNRRPDRTRKGVQLNVRVPLEVKQRLWQEAQKRHVDQSVIVRKGLEMAFVALDRGQLPLGFPEEEGNNQ